MTLNSKQNCVKPVMLWFIRPTRGIKNRRTTHEPAQTVSDSHVNMTHRRTLSLPSPRPNHSLPSALLWTYRVVPTAAVPTTARMSASTASPARYSTSPAYGVVGCGLVAGALRSEELLFAALKSRAKGVAGCRPFLPMARASREVTTILLLTTGMGELRQTSPSSFHHHFSRRQISLCSAPPTRFAACCKHIFSTCFWSCRCRVLVLRMLN
jgi:hypothetical protein